MVTPAAEKQTEVAVRTLSTNLKLPTMMRLCGGWQVTVGVLAGVMDVCQGLVHNGQASELERVARVQGSADCMDPPSIFIPS